jgi:hypothetical protein
MDTPREMRMKSALKRIAFILLWVLVLISLGLSLWILYQLNQARLWAAESAAGAAHSIAELTDDTFEYSFPVHQVVPIQTDVPLEETLSVPINLHISQTVPVQANVPFRDTIIVPLNATIPVRTMVQVPINIPLAGQRFVEVPISTTIPVNLTVPVTISRTIPVATDITVSVPISTEVPVALSHTLPISVAVPLDLEIPLTVEIAHTPLKGYLEELSRELLNLAEQIRKQP